MIDPLATLQSQIEHVGDAIRWACVLEATAPKAGNVHPGKSFVDLKYADFVVAAEIAAATLSQVTVPLGKRIHQAVLETRRRTGTNVNLGIILLLGPLVEADLRLGQAILSDRQLGVGENSLMVWNRELQGWKSAATQSLDALTADDGEWVFRAIRSSAAGGLGQVESMDVHDEPAEPVDLMVAMKSAAARDRVARQYTSGFADLIDLVVPVVAGEIADCGDVLSGIAAAHLSLLAQSPDTLIGRKCGQAIAADVQRRAQLLDRYDAESIADFDRFLRSERNKLNPGTTADLIAAALFILLRTSHQTYFPRDPE